MRTTWATQTICVLTVALAASCARDDDESAVRSVAVADFTTLVVDAPVAVRLDTGSAPALVIAGAADEVAAVRAVVADETLTITVGGAGSWRAPTRAPLEIHLIAQDLASVRLTDGARLSTVAPLANGDLELIFVGRSNEADLELDGGHLRYYCNGITAGLLRLRGRAEGLRLLNYGFVSVDARDLDATVATVNNASAAPVRVRVSDSLRYGITGVGDVEVWGDPAYIEAGDSSGDGRLVRW